jgi:eukaryotic-like serine/threonine-protein kinase
MAICLECRAVYGDDVRTCPKDGSALVPDSLLPVNDALAAGTMVGEYRIERKLGSGTFGDVYAGEHPLIGKRVAVKVLNRRFAADPEMVSRFVAEARAVNRIRQRNIIDIFSFGVLPDRQRQYFVMELLDGLTLGELLERNGRLPVPTVVHIVRGIAAGLDAAHEAGITHRDLKPANVFLAMERDGTYFPKLLDFGIAKLIGEDAAHKTGSGVVLGTPMYMSPEQARGKKADPTSDIYALGVIIHELLTGRPPFSGESPVDILLKHTTLPPPRMSSVCADIPVELDAPVLAMLAKRPKDRPKAAGQAAASLASSARKLGLERVDVLPSPASPASPAVNAAWKASDRAERLEQASRSEGHRPVSQVATMPRAAAAAATMRSPEPVAPAPRSDGAPIAREPSGVFASTVATQKPPDSAVESSRESVTGQSGQSTVGLASIETESSLARLAGPWRWRLIAGAIVGIAGGVSIWALGRGSGDPQATLSATSTIVTSGSQTALVSEPSLDPTARAAAKAPSTARAAAIAPSSARAAEPEPAVSVAASAALPGAVKVRLSTRPGSRPAGKPAASQGRMDRLLGDRD